MPLYTYKCPKCGRCREDMRVVAERNKGPSCDYCFPRPQMELQIDAVRGFVKNPAVARSKRR